MRDFHQLVYCIFVPAKKLSLENLVVLQVVLQVGLQVGPQVGLQPGLQVVLQVGL